MKDQTPNSDTVTDGIRVQAAAQFVEDQSDPDHGLHYYVYKIRIVNEGDLRATLLTRHWVILDAHNRRDDVEGDGVVGKHPDLGPGEMFEYTSSCPLRTEWGTMEGSYTFERENGDRFDAAIGRFFLMPSIKNVGVVDG